MRAALPCALACAIALPSAADEKEWLVGVAPAASLIHVGGRTAWGGGAGLDLGYGVSDALALRLTGAFTAQAVDDGTVLNYWAGAGLTYTIDILRLVPYIDFSIGVLGTRKPTAQGDQWSTDFGVEVGLGADYLIRRWIALGFVVRYHASLTAITEIPVYLYFGPRLAFKFGG